MQRSRKLAKILSRRRGDVRGSWLLAGGILGFVAVATGALGAHGLKERLSPDELAWCQTASSYALWHALVLVSLAMHSAKNAPRLAPWAARGFLGGSIVFSGTLWAMALGGPRWLGAITPLGGLGLLGGWLALAGMGLGQLAGTNPGARLEEDPHQEEPT